MLVQKLQLSKSMTILLIILGAAVVIGGGFFAYTKFFSNTSTSGTAELGEVPTTRITVPTLDDSVLNDQRFYKLNEPSFTGFTNQFEAVSLSKAIPLPIGDIQTSNPGYGRTLAISWKLPDYINFTSLRVYRSDLAGSLGEVVVTLPVDGKIKGKPSSYQDIGLTDNKIYYYRVRSVNADGVESADISAASGIPTDYMPPAPPALIQVEPQENGTIKISWTNPADSDFSAVNIYRSSERGLIGGMIYQDQAGTVSEIDPARRYYVDDSAQPNIPYYYTVTSIDGDGNESSLDVLSVPSRLGGYNPFQPIVY